MYHARSVGYSTAMIWLPMRLLFTLLRLPVRLWLGWRYRITVVHHDTTASLRPPYLLLGNHVSFWDPFLLGLAVPHTVHFLAADGNFRTPIMRILMRLAGAIPKAKARTDMESLHALKRFAKSGRVVSLFPEGQRTWDERSRAVLPATPKLARLLGVPVVAVQLRGAYLSLPRWSAAARRGRLELHVSTVLTGTEVQTLPRREIARAIDDAIRYDEGLWQERDGQLYVSGRRAEYAERAVFRCPECGRWDLWHSHGNLLTCGNGGDGGGSGGSGDGSDGGPGGNSGDGPGNGGSNDDGDADAGCGAAVWFAPSGRLYRLEADGTRRRWVYARLADWNHDQQRHLREAARRALSSGRIQPGAIGTTDEKPAVPRDAAPDEASVPRGSAPDGSSVPRDAAPGESSRRTGHPFPYRIREVEYLTGYRSRRLRHHGRYRLELHADHLRLTPNTSGTDAAGDAAGDVHSGTDATTPTSLEIPVQAMRGIHVQYATQVEFYADGRLHVLRMLHPQDSAYRLEMTVLTLQDVFRDAAPDGDRSALEQRT